MYLCISDSMCISHQFIKIYSTWIYVFVKTNNHMYLCIFHILLYQCRIKNDWEMIVRQEMPSRLTLAIFLEGNLCWCRCQDVSKVGKILLLFRLFTKYPGDWSRQSQPKSLRTRISGHPNLFHTRRRSFQHLSTCEHLFAPKETTKVTKMCFLDLLQHDVHRVETRFQGILP